MFYLEASGKNLYHYLINPQTEFKKLEHIVELTAQWLSRLHSLPTIGIINFNPIQSKVATVLPGPKKFLKIIEEKHSQYPKYYQWTNELFNKINELEKKNKNKRKYIIHGDIHPENVVYNENKDALYLIDYTDCCLADFTRDLGNFHQQLGYMAENHLTPEKIEQLQKVFLDSYLRARNMKLSAQDKKNFELYKAWTALRSAIFFLTIPMFDRPRADALFIEARTYLKKT